MEALPLRRAALAALPPVLALAAVTFVLRLWDASLSVPFEYSANDANYQLMLVKGVLEHGWWFTNSDLGAPFGQQLYDFAVGADNLQLALVKAVGVFSSDPATVVNLLYLASFPMGALTAFWVLRWVGIGGLAAVVCSVLYSLLPYHFARGEHHLFLAAYYAVPAGCYLALAVASGRRLFGVRSRGRGALRYLSRRSLITLAACAAVASTGTIYHAAFTLLLVAVALAVRLAVARRARALLPGVAIVTVVGALLAVNLAPSVAYSISHGRNHVVAHRSPAESELLGLKVAQLVLPDYRHRFAPLRHLAQRYATETVPGGHLETYDVSLGMVGAVGFVWLLGRAVLRALRGGRRVPLVDEAGVLTLAAVLIGATGAISSLIAFLITAQLRAWDRIVVFVAFFAFVAVGHLLDRLGASLGPGRQRRMAFLAILGAVLALGVADQTSPAFRPHYGALAAEYRADGRFVHAIERRLPRGAAVAQLPYLAFPEGGDHYAMHDYDPLVGYLHSRHLRWSYGAMKGRPTDWAMRTAGLPTSRLLPRTAAAGFDGIYLDRFGYPDRGARLETQLRRIVGPPALVSRDGRLAFYDLRSYRAGRLPQSMASGRS